MENPTIFDISWQYSSLFRLCPFRQRYVEYMDSQLMKLILSLDTNTL
jgi:hypothetical protein